MKILFGLLISFSFVVCITSCQKGIDWGLTNNPQSDSTFISILIILDTTQPPGADTAGKNLFTYDNVKRLSGITGYSVGVIDTVRHALFYQGNELLPFKEITDEIYSFGPGISHHQFITYYSYINGIVSKDSTIELDIISGTNMGANVSQYAISGNTVNSYNSQYNYIAGNYVLLGRDTSIYTTSNSGGNLVSQILVSGFGNYQNVQVTYDNKINPLSKAYKIKYPVFESYYFEVWNFQLNNPLHAQHQEPFDPPYNDLYTYIYRPDNYPVSATYSDDFGTPFNKVLYIYTKL